MEPNVAIGFLWFVVFLFSTTVHEAMHAFAAWKGGDPTAYEGGQVSLSPLPHIKREPIGMVVVPLITALTQGWAIGWASAPYDPHWASRHPGRAAVMSAADGGPSFAANLLSIFLMLNVLLAAFNMLPLPPLDGGAILEYFLPAHLSEKLQEWSRTPMFQMLGL